jgi:hypothetical protein
VPAITLRWGVVLEDATVGQAGETHTVSDSFACALIARGRAVLAVQSDPPPMPKDPSDGPVPVVLLASAPVPVVDGKAAHARRRR